MPTLMTSFSHKTASMSSRDWHSRPAPRKRSTTAATSVLDTWDPAGDPDNK